MKVLAEPGFLMGNERFVNFRNADLGERHALTHLSQALPSATRFAVAASLQSEKETKTPFPF